MRYLVLILGVLGALTAGVIGFLWLQVLQSPENQAIMELGQSRVAELRKVQADAQKVAEAEGALSRVENLRWTTYLLLAAVPLGLVGAVLGFLRRGYAGAALLFLAVLLPAIFVPKPGPPESTHVFTVFLVPGVLLLLAALCSLVVRRPPPSAAAGVTRPA